MLGINGILMEWDWIEWDVDGRLHVYHAWSSWVSLTMLKYCFITRSMCGTAFEFYVKMGYACMLRMCGNCGLVYSTTVELLANEPKMCSHLVCPFVRFFFSPYSPSLILFLSHSAFVLSSSSSSSSLQWLGIFSTVCGYYDITIHI